MAQLLQLTGLLIVKLDDGDLIQTICSQVIHCDNQVVIETCKPSELPIGQLLRMPYKLSEELIKLTTEHRFSKKEMNKMNIGLIAKF